MKLTLGQKIWTAGALVYFLVIMGDVVGLYNVPAIYMLAALAPLLLTWWVMPSMKELNAAHLRQGKRIR